MKTAPVVFLVEPPEALISQVFAASKNAKNFLVFSGSMETAEERLETFPDLRIGVPVSPTWASVSQAMRNHKRVQAVGNGNTVFLLHGEPSRLFKKVRLEKVLASLTKRPVCVTKSASRRDISAAVLG